MVHAIFYTSHGTIYLDPYTPDAGRYIVYYQKDLSSPKFLQQCLVEELEGENIFDKTSSFESGVNATVNEGVMRTYKMAIVTTVEYATYQWKRAGISEVARIETKRAAVLDAVDIKLL